MRARAPAPSPGGSGRASATARAEPVPASDRPPLLPPPRPPSARSFALLLTFQSHSGASEPPALQQVTSLPASLSVRLGPMSASELVRIARNQLGARSLSSRAAQLLGRRSAGSPFFCLELVKLLAEQVRPRLARTVPRHPSPPLPSPLRAAR